MFGIEFIEIGIGLFFAFFALSTICSTVVELFSKFRKLRAKHLRKAMGELLGEKEYNGIVDGLYDHRLISSSVKAKAGNTTYIDVKDFSNAVLDLLGGYADSSLYNSFLSRINKLEDGSVKTELLGIINASPNQIKSMEDDAPHFFVDAQFSQACVQLIRSFSEGSSARKAIQARIGQVDDPTARTQLEGIFDADPAKLTGLEAQMKTWFTNKAFCEGMFSLLVFGSKEMAQFKAMEVRIKEIKDTGVRERLLGILNGGAERVESIKSGLENWFNKSMYDLTELYKKRMRYFVGGVAVIMVFSLNADSVRLVRELWNDNELRAATVKAAENFMNDDQAVAFALGKDTTQQNMGSLVDSLKHQINEVHQLPLGWKTETVPWFGQKGLDNEKVTWWWLNKLLGLFITIGAVSLGSTYWYKQLKSLLNLSLNFRGGKGQSS